MGVERNRTIDGFDTTDAWAERGFDTDTNGGGERVERAEATQQQDPNQRSERALEYYRPPYDPWQLALISERSEVRSACVTAKAKGVAGFGFELTPAPDFEDDTDPEGEARQTIHDFWFDGDFQLGPDRTPATAKRVLRIAEEDYQSIGWLALEVLSNSRTGEPTGLAHIPAHTVRRRRGASGYLTLASSGQVDSYFGMAGDRYGDEKTFVNSDTGETADTVGGAGGPDTVANELIVIKNYSPLWPYYGTPDDIPALQTIEGDLAARKYNTVFFENDTVPRFVVSVEGGELTDRAYGELQSTLRELSKGNNTHRAVIIEAVADVEAAYADADVSINIEPLTVGTEEDASFHQFREDNRRDIMRAHAVPPVVGGDTESVNYANAQEQRREFANDVVRPLQRDLADYLYQTIHVEMLDIPEWTLDFTLRNAENRQRDADIAATRGKASYGTMTINERRSELGYEPLTDGEGTELPLGHMLVADLQQTGGGTAAGQISAAQLINDDALRDMQDDLRTEWENEEFGYDVVSRSESEAD